MFFPLIITSPEVGLSNPPIIFNNVLFPEPEVPTIAVNVSRSISILTPFKAFTLVSPFP